MRKVAMLTENQLANIAQWQAKAWKLGVGGTLIALAGGIASAFLSSDAAKVFEPFIMAYILWFGLCAGSLACVMLHHLAGGAWSFMASGCGCQPKISHIARKPST